MDTAALKIRTVSSSSRELYQQNARPFKPGAYICACCGERRSSTQATPFTLCPELFKQDPPPDWGKRRSGGWCWDCQRSSAVLGPTGKPLGLPLSLGSVHETCAQKQADVGGTPCDSTVMTVDGTVGPTTETKNVSCDSDGLPTSLCGTTKTSVMTRHHTQRHKEIAVGTELQEVDWVKHCEQLDQHLMYMTALHQQLQSWFEDSVCACLHLSTLKLHAFTTCSAHLSIATAQAARAPLQANIAIQNQQLLEMKSKLEQKNGKLGCVKAKLDKKSAENVELQQNLVVERVGAQNLRAELKKMESKQTPSPPRLQSLQLRVRQLQLQANKPAPQILKPPDGNTLVVKNCPWGVGKKYTRVVTAYTSTPLPRQKKRRLSLLQTATKNWPLKPEVVDLVAQEITWFCSFAPILFPSLPVTWKFHDLGFHVIVRLHEWGLVPSEQVVESIHQVGNKVERNTRHIQGKSRATCSMFKRVNQQARIHKALPDVVQHRGANGTPMKYKRAKPTPDDMEVDFHVRSLLSGTAV